MAGQGTPHRTVDQILDGIAGGAKGVISGVAGGLASAGGMVQRGLDTPWQAVGGPEQPLRAVDRLLDGSLRAAEQAITQGVIGSLAQEGKAVQSALDHPSEQIGIPPGLGQGLPAFRGLKMGRGFPKFPGSR